MNKSLKVLSYDFYLLKKTSCNRGEQYGFVAFCLGLCHILHQECPHQESVYFCAVKLQDQVPLAQGLVMFQFCSVLHWCKSKVTEKNNRNVIQ